MPVSPDIHAVLDRHLPRVPAPPGAVALPDIERLLAPTGLDRDRVAPIVERVIGETLAQGFPLDTLAALAQAYARGLGRIVTAESDAIRGVVSAAPRTDSAHELDRILSTGLPNSHAMFRALHGVQLRDALEDALGEGGLVEPEVPERVIALVDMCDSTPYIGTARPAETQQLVDALFEAGQVCTATRPVWAVKYVGDGVFLVGRDAQEVADACAHAVEVLERATPLRARAGIASGPVVRRAGDYFGPPVNLASRLTTHAPPSTLLLSADAAAGLGDAMTVAERRELDVRGVPEPVATAMVRLR